MSRKARDQQKYDYLVKVVIIGDTAVGKTNILLRYVNEEYKMSHITTIGVDFKIKTLNVEGTKIKMQIWDTAGQQRFKTITQTYYKGAAGVILVYSVMDRKTFHNIQNWIKQINDSQPQNISKIVVGNKCDCSDGERQVSKQQGQALAKKYKIPFLESSAKDNYNIPQIFNIIGNDIKTKLLEKTQIGGDSGKKDNIRIGNGGDKKTNDKKCQC